jgi:hypothetical protein
LIHAVKKIDRALKRFYRLENVLPAEGFLVVPPDPSSASQSASTAASKGALLIVDQAHTKEASLELGIYFHSSIRTELNTLENWPRAEWSKDQRQAFSVATEEISHFNYLVEKASKGQAVSQMEMELQGEVDRFLLAFMAERHQRKAPSFDEIFETYFVKFRWDAGLEEQKRIRYEDANRIAKALLSKLRPAFKNHRRWPELVAELRRFYNATASEKVRVAGSKSR